MIEKIKAGLESIADFYRTAPLGETMFLMGVGCIPLTYDIPFLLSMDILFSLPGVALTTKQFKLRHRLEKIVYKHGYDNRVFKTTTSEWCDRQTARVVAKNYGNLEDYVALCESNFVRDLYTQQVQPIKDRMSLSNLRHF